MSDYRIQIVHVREPGGPAAGWQPGDHVESDMIEEFSRRLRAKGIGIFRSEAKVLAAVREVWNEMLYALKLRI